MPHPMYPSFAKVKPADVAEPAIPFPNDHPTLSPSSITRRGPGCETAAASTCGGRVVVVAVLSDRGARGGGGGAVACASAARVLPWADGKGAKRTVAAT